MAGIQNFRTALAGFNREDVVRYIEYMNNQHNSQIQQLNTQLQTAQEALEKGNAVPQGEADLRAELDAALARCAELEAQLEQSGNSELETYRRAEKAERLARERAAQIYTQANAVLADATVKAESAAEGMRTVIEQAAAQLEQSKQDLQDAVAAMYAIRPEED